MKNYFYKLDKRLNLNYLLFPFHTFRPMRRNGPLIRERGVSERQLCGERQRHLPASLDQRLNDVSHKLEDSGMHRKYEDNFYLNLNKNFKLNFIKIFYLINYL